MFRFDTGPIALPVGAHARTHRRYLRHGDDLVLGVTQGAYRSYVYPLLTPRGFAVTSETPADHPHHASVWIGADHVVARAPASEGHVEEYTYNFYVDDVFQGRAPGRIVDRACDCSPGPGGTAVLRQTLEWQGPVEWGAPQRRTILHETRTWTVRRDARATILHVRSRLAAAAWPVALGPTRHAYFNARVAETMTGQAGGSIVDHRGEPVGASQTPSAEWIDCVGAVGGGHVAGVALMPVTDIADGWWFVADWGVVTWGPFRHRARTLAGGDAMLLEACIVAHDGVVAPGELREWRDEAVRTAPP